jgi:hypothetical protein
MRGEEDKEAVEERKRRRDGRAGKVTVTFSRYVTVNLLGFA